MSQSIERELKTLLTQENYNHLRDYLTRYDSQHIQQANYYYDTSDEQLKALQSALRLRVFGSSNSEWTIKQRISPLESIELTQTNETVPSPIPFALNHQLLKDHGMLHYLHDNHVMLSALRQTIGFATERYTVQLPFGLLALDKTHFDTVVDYELELETEDLEQALVEFNALLSQFGIHYQQADTKLKRAFDYKNNA